MSTSLNLNCLFIYFLRKPYEPNLNPESTFIRTWYVFWTGFLLFFIEDLFVFMQMSGVTLQQRPMILQSDLATDRVGYRGNPVQCEQDFTFVIRQFHRLTDSHPVHPVCWCQCFKNTFPLKHYHQVKKTTRWS